MSSRKHLSVAAVLMAAGLALACASESTGPTDLNNSTLASGPGSGGGGSGGGGGGGGGGGPIKVKCERRSNRSKASVDGNNLASGSYRARVTSGGNSVTSPARNTVGDEVEFDFDSNRNDIAQGATPIPANFIVVASGSDVKGEILNASGQVVRTLGVDCRIR